MKLTRRMSALAGTAAAAVVWSGLALADGTETLGPPVGITVASGTGTVAAGTGLFSQPSSFTVNVPGGATVKQVLLYWEGQSVEGDASDDTIVINGTEVPGSLIGGPAYFFTSGGVRVASSAYRADITGLGLVAPGTSTLTASGLSNNYANNGAGVIVIFDDGTNPADISLRDGLDLAFRDFPDPRQTTVPQTFTFAAEDAARTAALDLLVGSVASDQRPNALAITADGVTTKLVNIFGSFQGAEWDAVTVPVAIPAGVSEVTVQVLSEDDGTGRRPASLTWVAGGLTVPRTPPPPTTTTTTVPPTTTTTMAPPSGVGTGTQGYWRNHPDAWPVTSLTVGSVTYTKAQAITVLKQPIRGDQTYSLAHQLIAAKLNVANGSDSSCISATIADADAFFVAHPVGSGVSGGSAAWMVGEPLKSRLDDYNNGKLCAPHRD